jgi:hypothetical protein
MEQYRKRMAEIRDREVYGSPSETADLEKLRMREIYKGVKSRNPAKWRYI